MNSPVTATANATLPAAATPAPASVREQAAVEELQQYQKMVAQVAAAADGRVIVNRSETHAAVVIEHVFRSAKKEIDVITGCLHEPIYGSPEVIDAALTFFNNHPDGRINILSDEPVSEDHPLMAALRRSRDRIDLRVMRADLSKKTPYHFAVADSLNFRFEPDKSKFEAYGQFGEPKIGARLKIVFDQLQSQTPVAA